MKDILLIDDKVTGYIIIFFVASIIVTGMVYLMMSNNFILFGNGMTLMQMSKELDLPNCSDTLVSLKDVNGNRMCK